MGQTFFAQVGQFMRVTMPALVVELVKLNETLRAICDKLPNKPADVPPEETP